MQVSPVGPALAPPVVPQKNKEQTPWAAPGPRSASRFSFCTTTFPFWLQDVLSFSTLVSTIPVLEAPFPRACGCDNTRYVVRLSPSAREAEPVDALAHRTTRGNWDKVISSGPPLLCVVTPAILTPPHHQTERLFHPHPKPPTRLASPLTMRFSTFQAAIGSASILFSAQPVAANLGHRHSHEHYARRHGHGHGHLHRSADALGAPKVARKSTCSLPDHPDLVRIAGQDNNGFAMSPDEPCEDGKWCPIACKSGKLMAQWKPNTKQVYPESMVRGRTFFLGNFGLRY